MGYCVGIAVPTSALEEQRTSTNISRWRINFIKLISLSLKYLSYASIFYGRSTLFNSLSTWKYSVQIHTANNLLLLHLGIVDTLLCTMFLVFSAPPLLRGWAMPCTLHGFLFTLLHPVALWTVCGLNCDRYYAISSPLHYGALVSPRKV